MYIYMSKRQGLTKCVLNCSTQVCVLGGPVSGWHQQCLLETDSSMVPLWAALYLQRENVRTSRWNWKRDPVIFYRSAETLYNGKWMLPSMTTYCRHFPGVAFKRSANFSSSGKTGASLHKKNKNSFLCSMHFKAKELIPGTYSTYILSKSSFMQCYSL